jgi:DNA-directed RNA polymerase specialized sigma24 family protein
MSKLEESLSKTYLSIRGRLVRAVSRIVPPKEIEDIVQETYVRVCKVTSNEAIKYPRSFMMKTARNLALDYVKRSESRLSVSVDDDQVPEPKYVGVFGERFGVRS